jgi:preprotein translocase subunit SecG
LSTSIRITLIDVIIIIVIIIIIIIVMLIAVGEQKGGRGSTRKRGRKQDKLGSEFTLTIDE